MTLARQLRLLLDEQGAFRPAAPGSAAWRPAAELARLDRLLWRHLVARDCSRGRSTAARGVDSTPLKTVAASGTRSIGSRGDSP